MYGRTDSKGRLLLLLAVVIAMSGGLALRLAYWQIGQRQDIRMVVKFAQLFRRRFFKQDVAAFSIGVIGQMVK